MHFKASLDIFSKITTAVVACLFLIILLIQLLPFGEINYWGLTLSGSLYLAIFLITYGYHPTGYTLSANELIIHRPFQNKSYQCNEITKIEATDRSILRKSIRTFGVGGVFGYWGKFANMKYGSMTWYATRRDNGIVIVLNNHLKLLLTPDDLPSMLEKLQAFEKNNRNNVY